MNLTARVTTPPPVTASYSLWRGSPTTSLLWLGSAPACVVLDMLPEGLSGPLVGATTMGAQMSAHMARWAALLLEDSFLVETGVLPHPVRGVSATPAAAGGDPKHTTSCCCVTSSNWEGSLLDTLLILVVEARLGRGSFSPAAPWCPSWGSTSAPPSPPIRRGRSASQVLWDGRGTLIN